MSENGGGSSLAQLVRDRRRFDAYHWIKDMTDAHRREHRCGAYPFSDGSILGAIADARRPAAVLELGTALGYTACWWASRAERVDTIEHDPLHVQLARENAKAADLDSRITVHKGDFHTVLAGLPTSYDLVFFDGYEPPGWLITEIGSRLNDDGALVTTNLDLGGGNFRSVLRSLPGWTSQFIDDVAISVRAL